jgi:hypothetical protein
MKVLNKLHEPRKFEVDIEGLDGARLALSGQAKGGPPHITVPTDVMSEMKLFVVVPAAELSKLNASGQAFSIVVRDVESGRVARRLTTFRRP